MCPHTKARQGDAGGSFWTERAASSLHAGLMTTKIQASSKSRRPGGEATSAGGTERKRVCTQSVACSLNRSRGRTDRVTRPGAQGRQAERKLTRPQPGFGRHTSGRVVVLGHHSLQPAGKVMITAGSELRLRPCGLLRRRVRGAYDRCDRIIR
jgi:hypothetical protein